MKNKTVLLICGWKSHEHEISLRSAKNIYTMLVAAWYEVVLVWISKTNSRYSIDSSDLELKEVIDWKWDEVLLIPWRKTIQIGDKQFKIDVLFPINHGQTWEDGVIQWIATMLWVPCVWPWLLSSVQCFHKHLTKKILESRFIDCAPWAVLYSFEEVPVYETVSKELWNVLFVKPSAAGSSVWISKVTNKDEYYIALKKAFEIDDIVLVESAIAWREIEFAVVWSWEDIIISVPWEIRSKDWYTYEEKYEWSSSTECVVTKDLDDELLEYCKDIVSKTYAVLWCSWMARVDGFLTPEWKFIINEVNTLPWFTSISMYCILMETSGVTSNELMERFINTAS
jgi:D-alanine-D-alanine ligase